MSRKQFHKILVVLNDICKVHINKNKGHYLPPINLHSKQSINEMDKEITKLCNYLRNPELSYLNKFK